MLEKEYKYFQSKREQLVKEYRDKYVVIMGEDIKGYFDTEDEAIDAFPDDELGTFLVQKCIPQAEDTAIFRSRAVFA